MNRSEFAHEVANKMKKEFPYSHIGANEAKIWTVAVLDCLADMILREDKIALMNFGTFEKCIKKEHKRGDIKTGKTVVDPERMRLRFTISSALDKKIAELPVK